METLEKESVLDYLLEFNRARWKLAPRAGRSGQATANVQSLVALANKQGDEFAR